MPANSETLREYQLLNESWGWTDLGHRGQLEIEGEGGPAFLHSYCTNDVVGLSPGDGCEAFLTSVQGKTIGYMFVFRGEQSLVVETVAGQAGPILEHLDRYLLVDDVELVDRTDEWRELLVSGPDAAERLAEVLGQAPPQGTLAHAPLTHAGLAIDVRRVPWTRQPAFLLSALPATLDQLLPGLDPERRHRCGLPALEICRVEAGFPQFGSDIGPENLPQEIDRNRQAISFEKGCYLGQETVARIDALGHVNWYLRGLKSPPGEAMEEYLVDDKPVARLRTRVESPRCGGPLSLAFLRRGWEQPGTKIRLPSGDAEVLGLPLA